MPRSMPTSGSYSTSRTVRRSQRCYEKNKKRTRSAKRKLIRVHFVMLLMRFCEPFRRRKVMQTAKTVAAEGILSFVSLLSRLSGCPPYRILRKFTRAPVPVSRGDSARDLTGPWGVLEYYSRLSEYPGVLDSFELTFDLFMHIRNVNI